MRKPVRLAFLSVAVLAFIAAALLALSTTRPPVEARLLPEADGIALLDLRPIRLATHFDRSPVQRSAAFQQFIDATGIVPERDLDVAAFALHKMADPNGPNGAAAFSEVFAGRFDARRLNAYLDRTASARELYAAHTIYLIPSEGRAFRVVLLGGGHVAASNAPTPEQIHAIVDHSRAIFTQGPTLLQNRYHEVPAFASAWGLGKVALPFAEQGRLTILGMQLPLAADTSFVVSARYEGTIKLRIEADSANEADAARTAASLHKLLGLLQVLQRTQSNGNAEAQSVQKVIDSIQIEQANDRVALTAAVPTDVLHAP